ncbi:MAG: branched-chain amino acid aminotransferase [Rhodobacteraceae bacterium]|nr:MAG: branched-chain amino acid aminotransferase [Paracoccaceae bacterium]
MVAPLDEATTGRRAVTDTWTWIDGRWIEGDAPVCTARSHAAWLGSTVFDGARAFEGVTPDLDAHCARVNDSALALGLKPTLAAGEIVELAREGVAKFPPGAALYIRPTYAAERGDARAVLPDPESTRFHMAVWLAPMPAPTGFTLTTTRFRRPTLDCMPVNAKAACLYPNNARMLREAMEKGFDNALVCDALGNVAELATANVFMAKDGVVATPAPNGTFLNGVTRQRVVALLRAAGVRVEERTLTVADFRAADEIFSTGNMGKVLPIVAFDDRRFDPGPFFAQARALYWDFAHR